MKKLKLKNRAVLIVDLHQRPLRGDDVVRFAVLVDEPGVGLDPLPAVLLGEQPEDGEAALAGLDHWNHIRDEVRGSVSLLFTSRTPRSEHTHAAFAQPGVLL